VPLPFDFAAIGAPGCLLRVAPTVLDFGVTQPDGTLVQTLAFAHDPALLGVALFSQFAAVDPAANALGVTLSNAIATTFGG
jgi:hypothetical protein